MEVKQRCVDKQTQFVIKYSSYEEVKEAIHEFEKATQTKYVFLKRDKHDPKKNHVQWDQETVPYVVKSFTKYECEYGKDRNRINNLKRRAKTPHPTLDEPQTKYLRVLGSKKRDCPARLTIREIRAFPDYEIPSPDKTVKMRVSTYLKKTGLLTIQNQTTYYFVKFPLFDEHYGHAIEQSSGFAVELDSRVFDQLGVLMSNRVPQKNLFKELKLYVMNELFKDKEPPMPNDRRFFPTKKGFRDNYLRIKQNLAVAKVDDMPSTSQNIIQNTDPVYVTLDQEIVCSFQDDVHYTCVPEIQDVTTDVYQVQPVAHTTDSSQHCNTVENCSKSAVNEMIEIVDNIKDVLCDIQSEQTIQKANMVLRNTLENLKTFCFDNDTKIDESCHSRKRKRKISTRLSLC
ncbi:calcium-responsive transcription factor isoform X1 [Ciona intestinalis]